MGIEKILYAIGAEYVSKPEIWNYGSAFHVLPLSSDRKTIPDIENKYIFDFEHIEKWMIFHLKTRNFIFMKKKTKFL